MRNINDESFIFISNTNDTGENYFNNVSLMFVNMMFCVLVFTA